MIDFDGYQRLAHQTAAYDGEAYPWLGLAEEAGELLRLKAKQERGDRSTIDRDAIAKEAGDVLWMLSEILTQHGISLTTVAVRNLAKLEDRMIRGKIKGDGDER